MTAPDPDPGTGIADILRPYMGQVVAIRKGAVIASGSDFGEVIMWVRDRGWKADVVLRVPEEQETGCHE